MKLDWKKILITILQALLVLLGGAGGGAAIASQYSTAEPQAFAAVNPIKPEKKGADFAVVVYYATKAPRGIPGPVCYAETTQFTLRSDVADLSNYSLKRLETQAFRILNAAISNFCESYYIHIAVGGAMPYGFYGDLYPIVRYDGSAEAISPPITKETPMR